MDGTEQLIMKSKVVFNYNELAKRSRYDNDGIIILLYCLKLGYNQTIDKSLTKLCSYLGITRIPVNLFRNGSLKLLKNRIIITQYKTEEPMSYVNNLDFISYNITPAIKVDYLQLLSKRAISNKNNFIPINYVENIDKYKNNPLISIEKDIIHFTLEE